MNCTTAGRTIEFVVNRSAKENGLDTTIILDWLARVLPVIRPCYVIITSHHVNYTCITIIIISFADYVRKKLTVD